MLQIVKAISQIDRYDFSGTAGLRHPYGRVVE